MAKKFDPKKHWAKINNESLPKPLKLPIDTSPRPSDCARMIERGATLKKIVSSFERDVIEAVLLKYDGNILRTAMICGVTRQGLTKKMQIYNLMKRASEIREYVRASKI